MTKEGNVYIKNVFYMLSYAFQGLRKDEEARIASEEYHNTADLLCAVLNLAVSSLLKRGLHKEFTSVEEDLRTVKGKIMLTDTMRNYSKGNKVIACEHDDFNEDNAFNRIILCTLLQFAKTDHVKPERKKETRRIIPYFSGVRQVSPRDIRWNAIEFRSNNREYQLVINICYFALKSLLLTTEVGEYRLNGFIDDQHMHRLYEKFILEYYRKHYPELHANPAQVTWDLEEGVEVAFLPKMITDVSLFYKEKRLIIDAKFYSSEIEKHLGREVYHSSNLYQIHSYVKNADKAGDGRVSGMLLYAKTDSGVDMSETPFKIGGNEFSVLQLDLNQPFASISKKLNSIAESFMKA